MKTFKYYLSLLTLIVLSQSIYSQNIANGDFENWTSIDAYEEPDNMYIAGIHAYFLTGSVNATKSTDKIEGNFSVKLVSTIINSDTLFGLVTNSNDIEDGLSGGQPYTDKPDSVFFSAKYNIQANDTAIIFVLFKRLGVDMGVGMYQFTGSQTNWQSQAVAINWFSGLPVNPDTMLFAAVSSNPDGNVQNNSELFLDNVHFGTANAALINGGFENWTMKSFEQPDDWSTFNFASIVYPPAYVKKSTDAHNGTYALEITTQLLNGKDTIAHIANSDILNDNWQGGQRVYLNPMKLTGYYKYTPIGNDSAAIAIRTTRWDAVSNQRITIQERLVTLGAASSYTAFSIDLTHNAWPNVDTLGIAFGSSNIHSGNINVALGSKLLLDSLNITYFPVGISENNAKKQSIKIYPQPASDYVNFKIDNTAQSVKIIIYNSNGKLIKSFNKSSTSLVQINTTDLSSGVYFYQINIDSRISKGKFQLVK